MLLNESRPNVETSGELEEQFFSVADQGMIFDILRSKMYSNPILAICREVSCNARDAHREVGKTDVPIHIHIPTALEPYYKIKDFGPGISPDRMSNVFIKYTASTKRNDNVQTGGFGLGAKTPFSYADTFAITTNVDGIQYGYACFIDETKVGKLMLTSQAPTQEPNGTEIKIPVKPQDSNDFASWTEQACRHWTVKPITKGQEIRWTVLEPILEGKNWSITRCHDWNRVAMMVIDGIEYPLPIDTLRKFADAKLIDSSKGNFIMYFGVGELTLSASRENIFLDDKTKGIIKRRLEDIFQEIKQRAVDKIATFPNLWDANVYYRQELKQGFGDIRFLGSMNWQGIKLSEDYIKTECVTYSFVKGRHTRRNQDPNKLSRSTTQHLAFQEHSALFINDLPLREPTPRHVRKAFDDDPTLTSVQVIVPNDKVTIQDLEKSIHVDKMNPRLLSTITKATARAYTPASSRLLVFKFNQHGCSCSFRQTSYGDMDADKSEKVLCLLSKDNIPNNRQVVFKNKNIFDLKSLKYLSLKFKDKSFYGVDATTPATRLAEDFSDLEDIEDFIEEQITNGGINFVEIKFIESKRHDIDNRMLRNLKDIRPLITNPTSLFLRRMNLHEKVQQMISADSTLLAIHESLNGEITQAELDKWVADHPEYNFDRLDTEYATSYPLIEHLHYYGVDDIVTPLAGYINLVDKS
jgi:hypothetical protein